MTSTSDNATSKKIGDDNERSFLKKMHRSLGRQQSSLNRDPYDRLHVMTSSTENQNRADSKDKD